MRPDDLKKTIRAVADFPRAGINFYDLSTLFRDADAFRSATDQMIAACRDLRLDAVAGIEARGFILAGVMAHQLKLGLIVVRKLGKLPAVTESERYELEYGEGQLEMHRDAVTPGQRVLVIDDLLATGGTAAAAARLIERLGGEIAGFAFLVELTFLNGRDRLTGRDVFSLLHYD